MSRAVGEGRRLGVVLLVGEVLELARERERIVNDVICVIGRTLNVLVGAAWGMGLLELELLLLEDAVTGVDVVEDEDDEEVEGGMASAMRLVIGSAV